jgi:hypothetical protein
MTALMDKALEAINQLPASEQDRFAHWILDELDSDHQWTHQFANSADLLAELANEALREHRAGNTLPLDLDSLDDAR